jgi:DNA-nicking Smr family endonuclease
LKKKSVINNKDLQIWKSFCKDMGEIQDKDETNYYSEPIKKINKLDLHGFSLEEANKKVLKFINDSYDRGYKKLLVITGKGLRSNFDKNPYFSRDLNILKNSVPDFIKNHEISKKITKIAKATIKDGGEGAIYIFLKKTRE